MATSKQQHNALESAHVKAKKNRLYAFTLAVLLLGSVWLSALGGLPAAPKVDSSEDSSQTDTQEPLQWNYPRSLYSVSVDDFALAKDGSFLLTNEYAPGGLSKGYLENCMVLTPAVPFKVEALGKGKFRVVVENGTAIPETTVELPGNPDERPVQDPFVAQIKPHLAVRVVAEEGGGGAPIDKPFAIAFSKPMDFSGDLQNLVTFSPSLPCTMQAQEDQIIVTPTGMMPYSTYYSVTVSPMLKAQSGEVFSDAQMLEFGTENYDFSLTVTNQGVTTTAPGEKIVTEYQLDTSGRGARSGTVELLSIGNTPAAAFDAYLTFLQSRPSQEMQDGGKQGNMDVVMQTAQLPAVMTPLQTWQGELAEGLSTVSFENPGTGFYLLRTTVPDTKTKEPIVSYRPVQVTSPSIYFQSSNGLNMFWLNDSVTGKPLSKHTISFLRADFDEPLATAYTDHDGIAKLSLAKILWEQDYSQEPQPGGQAFYWSSLQPNQRVELTQEEAARRNLTANVFVIYDEKGQPIYADATESLSQSERLYNRYYSFFYLDRALYRPTDEIQFWGYLKAYEGNPAPVPQTLTVRFDPMGLDERVTVTVAPDGTYSGKLALDKVVSAEYEVSVEYAMSQIEKESFEATYHAQAEESYSLESAWIQVNEFEKAAYTIEATVDRPIYNWGDEIMVEIAPSFFDGTPAPFMELECSVFNPSTGNLDAITTVKTDAQGKAVYRFKAGDCLTFDGEQTWTPKRAYFYVKITNEGENVTYQGHYNYVPGAYAIRPTVAFVGDDNARLTILVNKITLENIKSEEDLDGLLSDLYYRDTPDESYDILLGEPADVTLDADVSFYYCRPYDGSYDEKDFDYVNRDRSFTLDVKDGKAVVEKLVDVPFREDTYMSISANVSYAAPKCTISAGHTAYNEKKHFYSAEESVPKGYAFDVYRNQETAPVQSRESYMLRDIVEADEGDQLRFVLTKDSQQLPAPSGKLFYSLMQGDIIEYGVTTGTFTMTQKQSYANNVLLIAAYFDGKSVYPVVNCEVDMNTDSLRLNVETTADQQSYLPGQQAKLTAKITDQDGKPVSASLCLSVVDEAVFALREQNFDMLTDLYIDMTFPSYYINKYTTSTGDIDPFASGGNGGKGDGNNLQAYDIFRKNFKDTAFFMPVQSDANGMATVSFTLPDNLTSWRVTTIAVNGKKQGGQNRSEVITSLPFFVKPVISSKYIAGDEIAMLLRGYGAEIKPDDPVDYSITLAGNGTESTQSYRKNAGELLTVNFGILPEGEYVVTATGKFGERSDTVELPLSVIHSNLELMVHQSIDLNTPLNLPNSRYPVTITFYHKDYEAYYACLSALLQHQCQRLDQRMARLVAAQAFAKSASDTLPAGLQPTEGFAAYQRIDGGIGWNAQDSGWENDGSQPILTTQAYLVAPEQFSEARIRRYLLQVTDDSSAKPLEQAAAWAGLAAMDPSFVATLHTRVENTNVLREQLWYGLGLACAGDLNAANRLYEELVVPKLDTRAGMLCLEGAGKHAEIEEATALAWAIATKLGLKDADGYAKYFSSQSWMGNALFEAMLYVKNSPVVPVPLQFTYQGGTHSGTVDLSRSGSQTLTFGKNALEGLSFQNVPEEVGAVAYYVGEPEETSIKIAENMHIEKEIVPLENGKYKNTVHVTLDQDAPYGQYTVSDWVPSNSRLHSVKDAEPGMWYFHTQEGQKLYFQLYHNQRDSGSVTITYYTQKAYDSVAMYDRTYLISADTGETAFTERGILE